MGVGMTMSVSGHNRTRKTSSYVKREIITIISLSPHTRSSSHLALRVHPAMAGSTVIFVRTFQNRGV
jgi:hypothetical protein